MSGAPDATPNYRQLSPEEYDARVESLWQRYEACDLCAHACDVDRTAGETGACQAGEKPVVSDYFPHRGEEEVLRGTGGSGTIFLANCNMACVFCQNFETSQRATGKPVSAPDIAEMALELQDRGCHNVNFVSPTHHSPHLVEAIGIARDGGLDLPVVWNCGGYERVDVLESLDGIVDVYMPDVKWSDDDAATTYSKAPEYWSNVRASLREMHRQVGDLSTDAQGLATEGLLVRHLVMPQHVDDAKTILSFLAEEISPNTYVNVMSQYRPHYKARTEDRYAAINRRLRPDEYREVVEHARDIGLSRAQYDPAMTDGGADPP